MKSIRPVWLHYMQILFKSFDALCSICYARHYMHQYCQSNMMWLNQLQVSSKLWLTDWMIDSAPFRKKKRIIRLKSEIEMLTYDWLDVNSSSFCYSDLLFFIDNEFKSRKLSSMLDLILPLECHTIQNWLRQYLSNKTRIDIDSAAFSTPKLCHSLTITRSCISLMLSISINDLNEWKLFASVFSREIKLDAI